VSATNFGYARRPACPGCGAPTAQGEAAVASAPPAESMASEEHGRFLSGYGARRVFFSYLRCPSCALLYCPAYYSAEQLARLYSRQAENMSDVPVAARERTQRRYVAALAPESVPDGDYLELGADNGMFASLCAERRRFGRYVLYEPNLEVRPEIDRRLRDVQRLVLTKDFSASDVPAGSISLAVVVHVLDHVLEPTRMLKDLLAALRPGGRLFLVTHNERSLLARVLGRRWPPYTLQHPQLYSMLSLARMAEACGFSDVRTFRTANDFPVPHLVRAGLEVLGLPGSLVPAWQHPQIALKLGNIALIGVKST
jgi:SAM-dependent methyltransferase